MSKVWQKMDIGEEKGRWMSKDKMTNVSCDIKMGRRGRCTLKGAYKEDRFREEIWQDFLANSTFVCSIHEKIQMNMWDIVL